MELVVDDRPPQPPRPSSTPITQQQLQQMQQPQQRLHHPQQISRAVSATQHSHSFNNNPSVYSPTNRRSFSAWQEPILNFLGESVIDGVGDILEPVVHDRPPQPPRPSSTPITQQQLQQMQQPQQRLHHPQQISRAVSAIQHSHSFNDNPSGSGVQPGQHRIIDHISPFQAFDDVAGASRRDSAIEARNTGASWLDSGVEATHVSGAIDLSQNASSAQRI